MIVWTQETKSLSPALQISGYFEGAIDWIILGDGTGHRKGKIRPEKEWITSIIHNARKEGIPLFIKDNVKWMEDIREYPSFR